MTGSPNGSSTGSESMLALLLLKLIDERTSHHTTLLKEIHGRVSVEMPKKSRIPSWLLEFGRMALRAVMPLAAPVLWAWAVWIAAMLGLGYKLAVKFILGS